MHDRFRAAAATVALASMLAPLAAPALAQSDLPSYTQRDRNTEAPPPPPSQTEQIHGRIASVDGPSNIQLNDDRGYVDNIQLTGDARIVPAGVTLRPGMVVTITGAAQGSVFAARRVDVADVPGPQGPAPQTGYIPPPSGQEPPRQEQEQQPPPERPYNAAPITRPAQVTGILTTPIDSKTAFVGEQVMLDNVTWPDNNINHARLLGSVTEVQKPGQGRNAKVLVHFTSIEYPDGTRQRIDGDVVSMDVHTKSNAGKEAGGALLGMLAGNALAKTLFGLAGGGIIGAVGGYLIAKDNRSDVFIPANSTVTVQLEPTRRQAQ